MTVCKQLSPEIVYLSGYGRSGSTLLDRILSQHDNILSSGEIRHTLLNIQKKNVFCSCGNQISSCKIWRVLSDRLLSWMKKVRINAQEMFSIQDKFEKRSQFFKLFLFWNRPRPISMELLLYRQYENLLFSEFSRCQGGCQYVVDSSKTTRIPGRPLALQYIASLPVHVIHLVRDPRGVLNSKLKGGNQELERGIVTTRKFVGIRTLLSWLRANFFAELITIALGKQRTIRIRYEDIVQFPKPTIKRIASFLDIDPASIISSLEMEALPNNGHMIAGNRMRLHPTKLDDTRNTTKLPWFYWLLTIFLCWPFMLLYGYRLIPKK